MNPATLLYQIHPSSILGMIVRHACVPRRGAVQLFSLKSIVTLNGNVVSLFKKYIPTHEYTAKEQVENLVWKICNL